MVSWRLALALVHLVYVLLPPYSRHRPLGMSACCCRCGVNARTPSGSFCGALRDESQETCNARGEFEGKRRPPRKQKK